MKIECLRSHVMSGNNTYPIYIGFAKAEDIAKVAMAPAFTRETPNRQIAENISNQPVADWQRPIDLERVGGIAETFNNTGGLMPNPVLLSNNAFYDGVKIAPKHVHTFATNTYEVDINEDTAPDQKSLWILDGQHRIFGLSKSAQKDNLVPIVLLLSEAAGGYTSPGLAKIFAQVTTAAKKLDELHNEWLTYAFELERYSPTRQSSLQTKQAFATVVELCRTPEWEGMANPFFNQVQFNETVPVSPKFGGFAFRCNVLSDLLLRSYFLVSSAVPHRKPAEVAQEIARAYQSLHQIVQNPETSVFFGSPAKQQSIVQEAFAVSAIDNGEPDFVMSSPFANARRPCEIGLRGLRAGFAAAARPHGGGHDRTLLVVHDEALNQLMRQSIFGTEDRQNALAEYERLMNTLEQPRFSVLLLNARTLESIKVTHPRFFRGA